MLYAADHDQLSEALLGELGGGVPGGSLAAPHKNDQDRERPRLKRQGLENTFGNARKRRNTSTRSARPLPGIQRRVRFLPGTLSFHFRPQARVPYHAPPRPLHTRFARRNLQQSPVRPAQVLCGNALVTTTPERHPLNLTSAPCRPDLTGRRDLNELPEVFRGNRPELTGQPMRPTVQRIVPRNELNAGSVQDVHVAVVPGFSRVQDSDGGLSAQQGRILASWRREKPPKRRGSEWSG
ncbi:hypothetical protein SAMN00790413_03618 [Deinococcus hopiensis KR-140]|uniref:Uncharacterized protein n=1 Tax=Deinococcus hopiensis KR-140 TaxID=695939 RepID=A0A1W1UY04_9DEIO|nr:hypothetical protein SAMN00790413_03618 [Deinococcus hopiensis KR-140]